jgi:Ca-activated chloride channel homolog
MSRTSAAPPEVALKVVGGDGGTGVRAQLELSIGDAIAPGKKASSPSHALATRADGVIELTKEGAKLDRDIVVRWPVAEREVGVTLNAARPKHTELHSHLAYGLVTIVPPSPDARAANVPRDLVVLLDTSGSMSGAPLAQAKKVVGLLIDALGPDDSIELLEFSYQPRRWRQAPVSATKTEKQAALAWVRSRNADGGTEMYSGVVEALRSVRDGAQRQVVLVTDGYIGNEQQIVDLCHERLPKGCRLHVVGVGSAVNRTLAMSLARAGRGAEILVGLDEDAERAAKRLLDRTAAPVLTDVTITGDAIAQLAPEHVPDVFAGAPIRAALSFDPNGGEIIVRGNLARGTWEKRIRLPKLATGEGSPAVTALYAREHVADLEMRWTIGREVEIIDRTIEKVGVAFQIATRRTSWVAIDEHKNVDPNARSRYEEMPHELPYGTSMASFGLGSPMASTQAGSLGMPLAQLMSLAGAPAMEIGAYEEDESPTMARSVSKPYFGGPPGRPPAAGGMGAPMGGPMPPPAPMQAEAPEPMPMRLRKTRAPWPLLLLFFVVALVIVALAVWFLTR